MAALSTLALATVAGVNAISDFSSKRREAKIAEQEGNYAGAAYDENARIARLQAEDALARGHEEEGRYGARLRGELGANRASTAAQGIDVGVGSAVDVQRDMEAMGELDKLTIRNNAAREAWGYNTQAAQYGAQAGYARTSGRNQAKALRTASLGSLLTGAADVYGVVRNRPQPVKKTTSGEYGGSNYPRGMFG